MHAFNIDEIDTWKYEKERDGRGRRGLRGLFGDNNNEK